MKDAAGLGQWSPKGIWSRMVFADGEVLIHGVQGLLPLASGCIVCNIRDAEVFMFTFAA